MGLWYENYIKRLSLLDYPSIKIFLSEFIGMSMFVLIGCNHAAISESNYIIINLQLALGYTFGLCMCIENGGFLNPAIALVFKVLGKMKWRELFANVLAQFSGAICGAALIYGINYDSSIKSESGWTPWIVRWMTHSSNQVPSIYTFFVKSGLLMMGVMSIIDERSVNPPRYVQPFMIGTILFSVGLTTNHITYCFLNLAQDLSPRIVLYIASGGCTEHWKPYNQTAAGWPLEILGPLIGAFAGAFIYILFIEIHHKTYDSAEECDSDFGDDEEIIEGEYRCETEKEEIKSKAD